MHYEIESRQGPAKLQTAKDLSHPSLDPMPEHRVSHLAAGRDPQTGFGQVVGMVMQCDERTVFPPPSTVATEVVLATAYPLIPIQTFVAARWAILLHAEFRPFEQTHVDQDQLLVDPGPSSNSRGWATRLLSGQRGCLGRQALPSLPTTAREDGPPLPSLHPSAESMGLLTTTIIGLKGTLHGIGPS